MPIETPYNQPAEWLKQQDRYVLCECDEFGLGAPCLGGWWD